MLYLMRKKDWTVMGTFENNTYVQNYISTKNLAENDYIILEEVGGLMNYISQIVFKIKDGETTCVYNDKSFWTSDLTDVLQNFNDYTFTDIFGEKVSFERFVSEMNANINRIAKIDGRPGQIKYDMDIGQEFITLFREECILTNFTKNSNTSPMIIFSKLTTPIMMLSAGAMREAKQWLQANKTAILDDFLTEERIEKYIDMLLAADAIEYATDEGYFYTVPEPTDETA